MKIMVSMYTYVMDKYIIKAGLLHTGNCMINKAEYKTRLLNHLNQYKSSLVDSDIEKISIINNLAIDPSLESLKNTLLNNATVFQNDELGKVILP